MILSITLGLGQVWGNSTLWGFVLDVFAMLIIDKQDIALPTTKHFFVVPKKHLVLFKEELYIYSNGSICIRALWFSPHKCQSTNDVL